MLVFYCFSKKFFQKESIIESATRLLSLCFITITFVLLFIFNSANSFANYSDENSQKQIPELDSSLAQFSNQYFLFTLTDDTEIIAKIDSVVKGTYYVKTQIGLPITLSKDMIKDIKRLRGEFVEGKYIRFDPNRTRLFFAPTAKPLEGGEGYFSVCQIFFPMLTIGITNFIAISGGVSLFPGAQKQIFYGNLKIVPLKLNEFSFAVGGLVTSIPDEFSGGIIYGCGTWGTDNNSLTIGLGLPHEEWKTFKNPIILLGGDVRLSNSVKFITENWIFTEGEVEILFSFGLRFFGDYLAADFGFFSTKTLLEEPSGLPVWPWIGFAYNFGGK
ncbi:MAG: hypothetical protein CH6_0777 [Candidatus Kapaibacterium sp.]|nr:MAG: hypothetical protein CH6_0777 [Candidatus Kapabacteria bacterium]